MGSTAASPVIALVASAGGISALQGVLRALPADLPAAVVVVQHLPPSSGSALPRILERAGAFPTCFARDGIPLEAGQVLVAPPDRHLLVNGKQVRVVGGPRENGHRPAADPLLASLALTVGSRAAAVVLSGALDDGAAGAAAVAAHGGAVFVQDPEEALYRGMPTAALAAVPQATVAGVDQLAVLLDAFVRERAQAEDPPLQPDPETERRLALLLNDPTGAPGDVPGEYVGLRCPTCDGPIYEVTEKGRPERYECLVGHGWSPETFMAGQEERIESALRLAADQLADRIQLARRMAERAGEGGRRASARMFGLRVEETERALHTIRDLLDQLEGGAAGS